MTNVVSDHSIRPVSAAESATVMSGLTGDRYEPAPSSQSLINQMCRLFFSVYHRHDLIRTNEHKIES